MLVVTCNKNLDKEKHINTSKMHCNWNPVYSLQRQSCKSDHLYILTVQSLDSVTMVTVKTRLQQQRKNEEVIVTDSGFSTSFVF